MRRTLRLLVATALASLLLLGAAAGLLTALSQGWQREQLRSLIASRLERELGVEVVIASLDGPLYPELGLSGIRIGSADDPLLVAERVALRLDASHWPAERRLVLERLRVEGPKLALERTRSGDWKGLAGLAQGDQAWEGTPWLRRLGLHQLEVRRGRLRLRWPLEQEVVEVAAGIEADASGLAFPWDPGTAREARGGLRLALEPGRVGDVFFDEGDLSVTLEGERLAVRGAGIRGDLGRLRLEGEADLTQGRFERLELEGELSDLARLPLADAPPLEGTLAFSFEGAGAFEQPAGTLGLEGRDLAASGLKLGALRARLVSPGGSLLRIERFELSGGILPLASEGVALLRVGSDAVNVESLVLASGEQRLLLSGTLHPQGLRPSVGERAFGELRVEARDLDVSRLEPLLPQDIRLGGRLDASLLADGSLLAPSLVGSAVWRSPRLGDVALERVEAVVSGEAGRAEASFEAFRGERTMAHAAAALRLAALSAPHALLADPATELELRADAFDLALLVPWLPRQLRDPQGRADLVLRLRGAEPEPQVAGRLVLVDGSVMVPLLRQRFEPIRGRLEFANGEVVLDDWHIGSPGAEALLEGRMALDGIRLDSLALRVAFDDFPLSRSPLLETDVAGQLRLEGPLDGLSLSGQLALDETRISLRESADLALREIRVIQEEVQRPAGGAERIEERPVAPGTWERARLDVALTAPRGTWVRGSGIQLEMEGALAFRKAPLQEAAVVGRAQVVRGRYAFQRKRFDVRRGTLTFDGGIPMDPLLDVEATHRVGEITVLLTATGRASAPTLRLSSDPPLPESDVLAYLLLGKPVDQLAAGQRMALRDAASHFAAGVVASEAEMLLEDALPIDTLEIRIAEDGTSEEIGVGKYLGDRVYVRYGHTLGPDAREKVGAEYRLNRNWSLEGDLDSNDSAGADVIFTFEY